MLTHICTYTCTLHVVHTNVPNPSSINLQQPNTHLTIPTCGNKESVASGDGCHITLGREIPEEDLALIGGHDPVLIPQEVLLRGGDQVEHLLSLDTTTTGGGAYWIVKDCANFNLF